MIVVYPIKEAINIMKVLGFVFLGLCLVSFGILAVKLGWFDYVLGLIPGLGV